MWRGCWRNRSRANRRPARMPASFFRPRLEQLESRVVPAPIVWTGNSSSDNSWTDPQNWQGNLVPSVGDDLIFPGGAKQTHSTNTFTGGGPMPFNSITFTNSAVGYLLDGSPVQIS